MDALEDGEIESEYENQIEDECIISEEQDMVEEEENLDDEDDEGEFMLRPILPVAPLSTEYDPTTVEPTSGEEYLRLVRLQTAALPFAVRTTESSTELADLERRSPPEEPLPTMLYSNDVIQSSLELCNFTVNSDEISSSMRSLPSYGDCAGWRRYLYSGDAIPERLLVATSDDDKQLLQLIKFHTTWLTSSEDPLILDERTFRAIVYILRLVDTRMTAGQQHCVRSLAKALLNLPSQQTFASAIVILIAHRFGQHDLLHLD